MKSLICIMVAIISVTSFGSLLRLEETKPFHLQPSDTLNQEYDQFVENKIDSLRKEECAAPFNYVNVIKAYDLIDLPCIKMYIAESGRVSTGAVQTTLPYEMFLFNICDSTIYPFGGGWVRFSKFIKRYLPAIYDGGDSPIRDLIDLYLNIQDQDYDYYIFTFKEDLQKIWGDNIRRSKYLYRECTTKQLAKEAAEVTIVRTKFEANQRDKYKEIQVNTWSNKKGVVEWWQFYLSRDVFEVRNNVIMYYKKGAYYEPYMK